MAQRCLNAHPRTLIYGEWGDGAIAMQALVKIYLSVEQYYKTFEARVKPLHALIQQQKSVANDWTAEMCPRPKDVAHGLAELVESACKKRPVWGFTSHYYAQHAHVLLRLYPDAKFVVALREPRSSFAAWLGYQNPDQAEKLIGMALRAYGDLFRLANVVPGQVLWIDYGEREHHRHYLVKLYKFLGVEIPRDAWAVIENQMDAHRLDKGPLVSKLVLQRAEASLLKLYLAGAKFAEQQAARDISEQEGIDGATV